MLENTNELMNERMAPGVPGNDVIVYQGGRELDTIAAQYDFDKEKSVLTKIRKDNKPYKLGTEYESGGAGMISTVDDYIKFLEALRAGRLLKRKTIEAMCENIFPLVRNDSYWHAANGYGYGLGVRTSYRSGDGIYDLGWDGAAGSYLAVDLEHEISVLCSAHSFFPCCIQAKRAYPRCAPRFGNSMTKLAKHK